MVVTMTFTQLTLFIIKALILVAAGFGMYSMLHSAPKPISVYAYVYVQESPTQQCNLVQRNYSVTYAVTKGLNNCY